MLKDISTAVNLLDKNNKFNEAYNNLANSTANSQRIELLKNKERGQKVTSGLITGAGDKITARNVITTNTGEQQVLTTIENLMTKYPEYKNGFDDIRKKRASVIVSDNTMNYPFRQVSSDDVISTPTYVPTDPVKPEDIETSQVNSTTVTKNKFNINSLYHDVSNINFYDNIYSDINTKKAIMSESIISYSDDGVVTRNSVGSENRLPTYRFIPSEHMEQTTITDSDNNVTTYAFQDLTVDQSNLHDRTLSSGIISDRLTRYKYAFCLDKVMVEHRNVTNVAGYVSKPFKVTVGTYVEIDVDTTEGIEYYVIDGEKETAILPRNVSEITDEKLFFGMMPRFVIMNPESITVKRNGILTGITTQSDLELFLTANTKENQTGESTYNNNDSYTITYKPTENARRYFPKTEMLRIKVIQRLLKGDVPKTVGSVKILQYNTPASWYLRSWDESEDYDFSDPKNRVVTVWNT